MSTISRILRRFCDHMLTDSGPKLIGLIIIGLWIFFCAKIGFGLVLMHPWRLLPLALLMVVPISIVAIFSGVWWTPTYPKGGGVDD